LLHRALSVCLFVAFWIASDQVDAEGPVWFAALCAACLLCGGLAHAPWVVVMAFTPLVIEWARRGFEDDEWLLFVPLILLQILLLGIGAVLGSVLRRSMRASVRRR
jgi:hypothetical protein